MKSMAIDLCGVHPGYASGVNRFSLDLTESLLRQLGDAEPPVRVIVLVSNRSAPLVRNHLSKFKNVKLTHLSIGKRFWVMNRLVALVAWTIRYPWLRIWFDRLFRASLLNEVSRLADIVYCPTTLLNFYGLTIPSVVSIHDIQHEFMPEFFSLRERIGRWAIYRATCRIADGIQVSSDFIGRSICEAFGDISASKLHMIPEGVSQRWFMPFEHASAPPVMEDVSGTYLFYPAQLWKHKNHLLLADALRIVRDMRGSEVTCVLTGADKGVLALLAKRLESYGLKRCLHLGLVPEAQLRWLYEHCACVLALGIYESSCLPIKEAAALGLPVIAADIEPNVELGSIIDIEIFERDSAARLATSICRVLDNLEAFKCRALRNSVAARQYDWDVVAMDYVRVLSELVLACASLRSK